jgi:hypothetical protein
VLHIYDYNKEFQGYKKINEFQSNGFLVSSYVHNISEEELQQGREKNIKKLISKLSLLDSLS